MFEIIFIIVLIAFAAGGIWAFTVTKKAKMEGIETDAAVTRVVLHEWSGQTGDIHTQDSYTEEYYITYTNQQGQLVEAMLTNP